MEIKFTFISLTSLGAFGLIVYALYRILTDKGVK